MAFIPPDYYNKALRQQQLNGLRNLGGLDSFAGMQQQQIAMERETFMQAAMNRPMADYERKLQKPKARTIREELQDEVDEWIKGVI